MATKRKTGYVVTPESVARDMRAALKAHGVQVACDACGLARVAVLAIAAELVVQVATLEAAEDGIRRMAEGPVTS